MNFTKGRFWKGKYIYRLKGKKHIRDPLDAIQKKTKKKKTVNEKQFVSLPTTIRSNINGLYISLTQRQY